ncbi:MAG: CapK related-protein [Planctomycetaceae bacterium]|nr:CapK related-protein [Planctomycetaceae bacterium]
MYGKLYRNVLLPLFDGVVKRRHTMSHWRDVEQSQWLSREQLEDRQLQALRALVEHAQQTCPYYAEEWGAQGLNATQLRSLQDFTAWPLLTREMIRCHREKMRTTNTLKRISKATGGSSGEPLRFDLDSGSNDRRTAMMYRGYGWAGGAPGTKQLHIWGTAVGDVPKWKRFKMNLHRAFDRHLVLSCFEFTPERMRQNLDRMNGYRAEVIVAYTNSLYDFALFLKRESLVPVSPRSIIVGAEKLHDFQRTLIEEVFRAPVFETYGSREFMLIGAECDKHTGLHLSMENLLVEVLDEDGSPTPAGQEGNVVITDLFNYGMPFVRYVSGDRAIAGFETCSCGRGLPLLKKVVGRSVEILTAPDGRRVSGLFIPHLMKEFPAVRRFQVVQQELDLIDVKLVVEGSLADADRELMLSELRRFMGTDVHFNLQFMDHIPLTAAGKMKVVVNAIGSRQSDHNRELVHGGV